MGLLQAGVCAMASGEQVPPDLLHQLDAAIQEGEHRDALQAASQSKGQAGRRVRAGAFPWQPSPTPPACPPPACLAVLQAHPRDPDAYAAKVAAHMQLSEWEQALALISKAPAGGAAAMQFERVRAARMGAWGALHAVAAAAAGAAAAARQPGQRHARALASQAYCLYRMGRIEEVRRALVHAASSLSHAHTASPARGAADRMSSRAPSPSPQHARPAARSHALTRPARRAPPGPGRRDHPAAWGPRCRGRGPGARARGSGAGGAAAVPPGPQHRVHPAVRLPVPAAQGVCAARRACTALVGARGDEGGWRASCARRHHHHHHLCAPASAARPPPPAQLEVHTPCIAHPAHHALPTTQADGLDLKTNVLAAYVAAGLSREVPDLMAAMKLSPKSSFEVRACARARGCVDVWACGRGHACVRACGRACAPTAWPAVQLARAFNSALVARCVFHDVPQGAGCVRSFNCAVWCGAQVGYNKACALVEAGEWGAAEVELKMAIKLGGWLLGPCGVAPTWMRACTTTRAPRRAHGASARPAPRWPRGSVLCLGRVHWVHSLLSFHWRRAAGREALFEEECSEEEVEAELAPLTVQLGYVVGRLGRGEEAQELHEKVGRARTGAACGGAGGRWAGRRAVLRVCR